MRLWVTLFSYKEHLLLLLTNWIETNYLTQSGTVFLNTGLHFWGGLFFVCVHPYFWGIGFCWCQLKTYHGSFSFPGSELPFLLRVVGQLEALLSPSALRHCFRIRLRPSGMGKVELTSLHLPFSRILAPQVLEALVALWCLQTKSIKYFVWLF